MFGKHKPDLTVVLGPSHSDGAEGGPHDGHDGYDEPGSEDGEDPSLDAAHVLLDAIQSKNPDQVKAAIQSIVKLCMAEDEKGEPDGEEGDDGLHDHLTG